MIKIIMAESKYPNLETGDIILFSGEYCISRAIEIGSNSKWSHIGIILKNPTYFDQALKGLYLWESGQEAFVDAENGVKKFGVQISDFEEVMDDYKGKVVVRKLNAKIDNLDEKLTVIHKMVHNKEYDFDLFDFISTRLKINYKRSLNKYSILNHFTSNYRRSDRFFCSGFVACIYTELKLLPENTEWERCEPKTFSEQNKSLTLVNATLGKEVALN